METWEDLLNLWRLRHLFVEVSYIAILAGVVKFLRLLQGLLYQILNQRTATINPHFSACDKAGRIGY